jgi:hypothetical protein
MKVGDTNNSPFGKALFIRFKMRESNGRTYDHMDFIIHNMSWEFTQTHRILQFITCHGDYTITWEIKWEVTVGDHSM